MSGPYQQRPKKWRTRDQIVGFEANVVSAIEQANGTNYGTLPLATLRGLVEICQQARWIELLRERDVECQSLQLAQDMQIAELIPGATL